MVSKQSHCYTSDTVHEEYITQHYSRRLSLLPWQIKARKELSLMWIPP